MNISFTSIEHLLIEMHWTALYTENNDIHIILVIRKAEGRETLKKILFPSEILAFSLITLLTTYT
jgi:hypothetical protein